MFRTILPPAVDVNNPEASLLPFGKATAETVFTSAGDDAK